MSVKEKMKNNYLISINNLTDIDKYKKVGGSAFLFALDSYTIGYNTFTIEEINSIQNETKYVLINRLLSSRDIINIETILPKIECNGFVIEDIGLINLLKPLNKKIILFMNHFNCNYVSINEWLEYVDSVVISNELTEDEIETIVKNTKKPVVVQVFGHNQMMYSRRLLLTNYYQKFNLPYQNNKIIKDKLGNMEILMCENKYGTIGYSPKIFDGRRLLKLDNVLYFYLNTSFIELDTVLDFLNNKEIPNSDSGFLDKPTVFKISDMK